MSAPESTDPSRGSERSDPPADRTALAEEIVQGLTADDQKTLPCKWLYDEKGSQFFDAITELDAYYPTRTELSILEAHVDEIARLCGPKCTIIEYGAGSVVKVRILLDALEDPVALIPIDISGEHLAAAAAGLARDYPGVDVRPIEADYTRHVPLPPPHPDARKNVAFFPGSTLGNFHPEAAQRFLASIAETIGRGGGLLIGVDRKKDAAVLELAYNDPDGVTAAFDRNILVHLNRELGTDFDVDRFLHRAIYDAKEGRIEMHLFSTADQTVRVGDVEVSIASGESIRTECSYKYTPEEFQDLSRAAGFECRAFWTDPKEWFAVYFLEVA